MIQKYLHWILKNKINVKITKQNYSLPEHVGKIIHVACD